MKKLYPPDYERILKILRYDPSNNVVGKPLSENLRCFSHRISTRVALSVYVYDIIYLLSDSTVSSVTLAMERLRPTSNTIVIKPRSLALDIAKILQNPSVKVLNPKEFVANLLDGDNIYRDKIKSLAKKEYVEPQFDTLEVIESASKGEQGVLRVVLASPGHGKTFYTKNLAASQAKTFSFFSDSSIPIYINSTQWKSAPPEDLNSLWKIIALSFKWHGFNISWLAGNEQDFIESTLGLGLYKIIFDGFDEYILQASGKIFSNNALYILSELALVTKSEIVLTSRTTFWENAVDRRDLSFDVDVKVERIKPFSSKDADKYFALTLKSSESVKRASLFYASLCNSSAPDPDKDFFGKGLTLKLVSDLFRNGAGSYSPSKTMDGYSFVPWMMNQLCEREVVRQGIELSPDNQMKLIKEIAATTSCNKNFDAFQMEESLFKLGATGQDLGCLVGKGGEDTGKLALHPLLKKNAQGHWGVKNEQILFNVLAESFLSISEKGGSCSELEEFISCSISHPLRASNVANAAIEQIISRETPGEAISSLKNAIERLIGVSCNIATNNTSVSEFATMLALQSTAKLGSSRDKKERSRMLRDFLMTDGLFQCLYFSGEIQGLDFSDDKFEKCTFSSLKFISCNFSKQTIFNECNFRTVAVASSDNFVYSNFSNCEMDELTKYIIKSTKVSEGTHAYDYDLLKHDVRYVIDEIIYRDSASNVGFSLGEIQLSHANISKYYKIILDEFVKSSLILIKNEDKYKINPHFYRDFESYAEDGILTGEIRLLHRRLISELL